MGKILGGKILQGKKLRGILIRQEKHLAGKVTRDFYYAGKIRREKVTREKYTREKESQPGRTFGGLRINQQTRFDRLLHAPKKRGTRHIYVKKPE